MPTTIFLSLRGDDASRVLESFRRALGEEATSLVVVPTNDESGYHGSAEVGDVAAVREAFALARKPFPSLRAYIGAGGRDEGAPRPASVTHGEGRPSRAGEARPRSGERPHETRSEGRGRATEQKGRGQERNQEREASADGETREQRRAPMRGRNRNG
ncbi:MAG TPA: hypothetical protein VIL85_11180, partial [Thermomicrobiales bacterium]